MQKICPNCSKENGGRTILCQCAYHFPTKEIRKDLLEEKNKIKEKPEQKIYDKKGTGRKECPSCGIIVVGVTKVCPKCNFDFISAKEEREKEKELKRLEKENKKNNFIPQERMSQKTFKLLTEVSLDILNSGGKYIPPYIPTKKENAKRFLEKDIKTKKILYNYAMFHHCWNHIDWKYVGEKLGLKEGESFSEKEIKE